MSLPSRRVNTAPRLVGLGLVTVAALDWLALKTGVVDHPPELFAALIGLAAVAFSMRAAALAWSLASRTAGPGARVAELLVLVGMLIALGAGMVRWALDFSGYVVLSEGTSVRWPEDAEPESVEVGPLARPSELAAVLALGEVELVPGAGESFSPVSKLRVWLGHAEPVDLSVSPRGGAGAGSLRFYQGAFGYAPTLIVWKGEEKIFEEAVPFTTARPTSGGSEFSGQFELTRHGITAEGAIVLERLDADLRGHVELELALAKDGAPLGKGRLLVGHGAQLGPEYRVLFAGVKKWSEIVVSRRDYGAVMLAGVLVTALGGALALGLGSLSLWRRIS